MPWVGNYCSRRRCARGRRAKIETPLPSRLPSRPAASRASRASLEKRNGPMRPLRSSAAWGGCARSSKPAPTGVFRASAPRSSPPAPEPLPPSPRFSWLTCAYPAPEPQREPWPIGGVEILPSALRLGVFPACSHFPPMVRIRRGGWSPQTRPRPVALGHLGPLRFPARLRERV